MVIGIGRVKLVGVTISLGLIWALVAATSATAGLGVVGTFGEQGSGAGQFGFPAGVAVNETSGDVYVADGDCCSFIVGY